MNRGVALLSHALLETWQRRDPNENRLTLAGYTELAACRGPLPKPPKVPTSGCPPSSKNSPQIFLRLTELGDGTQITRCSVSIDELNSI
ncbi:MAG: hypothetical protein H6656_13020 [Ardenticatenaceae bacterium]|nr:hypothetical protein [Ardenticatenaceae bacterium]